jgi:hypothetical protein
MVSAVGVNALAGFHGRGRGSKGTAPARPVPSRQALMRPALSACNRLSQPAIWFQLAKMRLTIPLFQAVNNLPPFARAIADWNLTKLASHPRCAQARRMLLAATAYSGPNARSTLPGCPPVRI